MKNKHVQRLLQEGNSWSEMWLKFGQQVQPYDENFMAVSNYAINNEIGKQSNNKYDVFDTEEKDINSAIESIKKLQKSK